MDIREDRYGLELDDNRTFHNEIELVAIDQPSFVGNENPLLCFEFQPLLLQLQAECALIDDLPVARSENPVHGDPASDAAPANVFDLGRDVWRNRQSHINLPFVPSCLNAFALSRRSVQYCESCRSPAFLSRGTTR